MNVVRIEPNPGFQTDFLASPADILIAGGDAGSGKSFGMLWEPLRHVHIPTFRCVTFRRFTTELTQPGGIWEDARKFYEPLGAHMREGKYLDASWAGGAKCSFRHMQHEHTRFQYQGMQAPLICFDELPHFTWRQFSYLAFSRGRKMTGRAGQVDLQHVKRYVRATANPDADSWVAKLIEWWIDSVKGTPIPERNGLLRWFVRVDDEFRWATPTTDPKDSKARRAETEAQAREELAERFPGEIAESLAFLEARLHDNPHSDTEEYRAGLQKLDHVQRERLLGSNWKIRELPTGLIFHNLNQRTMEYDDEELPEEARERWPLFAGIDFGTDHYKTIMPGCLVQFGPRPHYWIDFETCLPRANFADFLDDFDAKRETYGDWKWVYGDPAGRQHHKDNTTWIQDIRARGWAFSPIGDIFAPRAAHRRDVYDKDVKDRALIVNSQPWKRQAIRIVNDILGEGRIHIHERCAHMWRGLANWRWDLPEDMSPEQLELLNRQHVDVRHDAHSDKGMALLYLILGIESWIRSQRVTGHDDAPLVEPDQGPYGLTDPDVFALL